MYVLGSSANILRLENLSIGYKEPLLKNISASFGNGITGIIGNNGKGKTTLLRSICGLLSPLGGRVTLNEKDITGLSNIERARAISFNFSSSPVSFPVAVHELVSMGRYPYVGQWATLAKADEEIVDVALEEVGIVNFRTRKVSALSDGERQKVFIAKSLAQQTPVMLFDEPTAYLDYASKKYFFKLMKDIAAQKNKVVLISSHDIDFLVSYADTLFMIEDNEAVQFGPTTEIARTEYFTKHFTK